MNEESDLIRNIEGRPYPRAPKVWPPSESDRGIVGYGQAMEILERLEMLGEPDPLMLKETPQPHLYLLENVEKRLAHVLGRFHKDFMSIFTSQRRRVVFEITPCTPGGTMDSPSTMVPSFSNEEDRHYIITLTGIPLEIEDPDVFAGAVVFELSHIALDYPQLGTFWLAPPGYPSFRDREEEATALCCELGFAKETLAYINCVQTSHLVWGQDVYDAMANVISRG